MLSGYPSAEKYPLHPAYVILAITLYERSLTVAGPRIEEHALEYIQSFQSNAPKFTSMCIVFNIVCSITPAIAVANPQYLAFNPATF